MTWCTVPKFKDGFRWRGRRRSAYVCSASTPVRHGSGFSRITLLSRRLCSSHTTSCAAYVPSLSKEAHRFTSNTTADWGPLFRPYWCTWRAALKRSAVLTRPSRSTRASSVGANITGATLLKGQWVFGGVEHECGKTFLVLVPDRTADTMKAVIDTWIEPGARS